jgi:hypothetical protein
MADFETELSGLFQEETGIDAAVGERLADKALARIDGEDRRRGLVLTTAVITGVAAAVSVVARSGAVGAVRDLAALALAHSPAMPATTVIWPLAAAALALGAAAVWRPWRNA